MRAFVVACALVALTACSSLRFPGVHRIVIQQGNVVTPAMIEKLKPGMSKNQVRFVMGNAVVAHPFNQERWDYIYTADVRGEELIERRLSLHFDDNGKLTHFEGNYLDFGEERNE